MKLKRNHFAGAEKGVRGDRNKLQMYLNYGKIINITLSIRSRFLNLTANCLFWLHIGERDRVGFQFLLLFVCSCVFWGSPGFREEEYWIDETRPFVYRQVWGKLTRGNEQLFLLLMAYHHLRWLSWSAASSRFVLDSNAVMLECGWEGRMTVGLYIDGYMVCGMKKTPFPLVSCKILMCLKNTSCPSWHNAVGKTKTEVAFLQVVLWPWEGARISELSSTVPFCHISLSKKGEIFCLSEPKKKKNLLPWYWT